VRLLDNCCDIYRQQKQILEAMQMTCISTSFYARVCQLDIPLQTSDSVIAGAETFFNIIIVLGCPFINEAADLDCICLAHSAYRAPENRVWDPKSIFT
jgi:hypothetical protein